MEINPYAAPAAVVDDVRSHVEGGLLGVIPLVGRLAWLVDVLLIFGTGRRGLHDLIADTIVIDV